MKTFLSILPVAFLSLSVWGETAAPLTWQECVRLASLHNPDVRSAARAQEASRAQYLGSYNGILPKVSLTHSYSDSSSSVVGEGDSKIWDAHGTASLDLIDFGQWATIQSASASLRQSRAAYAVTTATTLLNLYRAFAGLLYAQEEAEVFTNIRDTWKANANMINLRYRSGTESKGNDMNTQAQLLQSDLNLVQAGRDLESAQQQLSQVVGFDEFHALVATGTWAAEPAPTPHPDFDALLAKIPQIQVQEAVVEQTRAAVKIAHSSLWPNLSVSYSKGVDGTSEFPSDPYWSFTGQVSYPLFGGGLTATYYASQAAERSYEKAQEDLRSLRSQTLSALESAWSAYVQAEDQIRIQRAFLDADRQRKAEYDILYQSGLMTFQEWILVVEEYVNFQTSFLRSEQSLILAQAQWRFAIGQQLGA